MKKCILAAGVLVVGAWAPRIFAVTGPFTGPLTNAIVSSDMNGGNIAGNQCTTEGFVGATGVRPVPPDPFGVSWIGWGGPGVAFGGGDTGGDSTQLPSSQSTPNISANTISKTFGAITATVKINTTTNAASYAQVLGAASMNSRDRGSPSGAATDNDLFRDLLFAGGSGANVQSTNYLQLQLSGLNPSTAYTIAAYSFDSTGPHTTNWSAIAPTTELGLTGYFAAGSNTFQAPADEQSITWVAGTATQAPAVFNVTSDGIGVASVYGWGGSGVSGNQNSDTTYLNGFQVALVPEPASLAMIGLGATALIRRRRV